jgi:nucleoside-diphosphate-sugar epimerase
MRELTGWQPRFTLDDILEATIAEAIAEQKEHE